MHIRSIAFVIPILFAANAGWASQPDRLDNAAAEDAFHLINDNIIDPLHTPPSDEFGARVWVGKQTGPRRVRIGEGFLGFVRQAEHRDFAYGRGLVRSYYVDSHRRYPLHGCSLYVEHRAGDAVELPDVGEFETSPFQGLTEGTVRLGWNQEREGRVNRWYADCDSSVPEVETLSRGFSPDLSFLE